MKASDWMEGVSARCGEIFSRHDARMTMGGEPTFVPIVPEGPEWSYSAVGPTKLGYAQAMARRLLSRALKGGADFFSPGKSYPGEVNPRWAIRLIVNRDGSPIFRPRPKAAPTANSVKAFRRILLRDFRIGLVSSLGAGLVAGFGRGRFQQGRERVAGSLVAVRGRRRMVGGVGGAGEGGSAQNRNPMMNRKTHRKADATSRSAI